MVLCFRCYRTSQQGRDRHAIGVSNIAKPTPLPMRLATYDQVPEPRQGCRTTNVRNQSGFYDSPRPRGHHYRTLLPNLVNEHPFLVFRRSSSSQSVRLYSSPARLQGLIADTKQNIQLLWLVGQPRRFGRGEASGGFLLYRPSSIMSCTGEFVSYRTLASFTQRSLATSVPLSTTSLTMHTSIFVSLITAATFVSGLPVLQERSPGFPTYPTFPTGGNAQTGSSGNVNGGDVVNEGWKIQNYPWANNAGNGGYTQSGNAYAGSSWGGGGNALSGNSGNANGGSVGNFGGVIVNGQNANHAGNGGTSVSGNAYGGNAKRGYPYYPGFGSGGNAQTGNSGNVNGGDVVNYGGYVWNGWGANQAGNGGYTKSGNAYAGSGFGGGGNAVSGNSGNANGGSVYNSGGTIVNGPGANKAGNGGTSISGNAYGGNAKRGFPSFPGFATGGNAQTGNSGNANGGDVVNEGGYIWNGWGSNQAGNGGYTKSGNAYAGSGFGGGGNAVSGNSGNANGGSVYNGGYVITNGPGANQAGNGGTSVSGDAYGGNAH